MSYQHKPNTGSLFQNERREKETHPQMTGSALIDGVEYWISAWTNTSDKGRWQSLSFRKKEQNARQNESKGEFSDDIPF